MPHALLLSPDDQAVSAITAVLEEMSVTCERPLDGPSAAKKLNAQSFDLVLVDCENLPAAKLIFDVCRRSQTGTNPVPIAIVDGRAGLPTAFRLGAELILTKPVAKDQARTTIRTAVSRVRKDEPARNIHPIENPPAIAELAIPEQQAQAAAASATGSGAKIADHSFASPSAEPATARMNAVTDEIAATPVARKSPSPSNKLGHGTSLSETDMFMPAPKATPAPSDDPVLADLDSDSPTPVFTSYVEPKSKKKTSGSLVALLLLMLAGGGLYAAWMYQSGFREAAQPLIDRLVGMVENLRGTPQTASPQLAPTSVPVKPAPATTAIPSADASAAPANTSTLSPATAATDTAPPAASAATASAIPTPDTTKPEAATESKKVTVAALPADGELPGEKSAVILSSQGAEKRLLVHAPPIYPSEARKSGIEGTVVLKAVVSDTGRVDGVRLVEGNPALAVAAISAVKKWHYRPYLRDGKALPFQTIVLVEFQRP